MKPCLQIATLLLIVLCFNNCKKKDTDTPIQISVVAEDLQIPWGMAYLPNGDLLFCERNGKIHLMKNGSTTHSIVMQRQNLTQEGGEGGLLGLTVDPDFSNNHYIYIYETTSVNRVVRLTWINETLTEDAVILDNIPAAKYHNGGALRFGPDGYLYVGTGDALTYSNAQVISSLSGKILRMDRNGNAAPGNPFGTLIWSYGHRNVQGFDWNNQGKMIESEHGPSGEFGWHAHDEINLIEPGKNYGWPLVIAGDETDTLTLPLIQSGDETWAPSGGTIIQGAAWGDWQNNYLVGCLRGERLIRFVFNATGDSIISKEDLYQGEYKRLRNVIQSPSGDILFSTSNYSTTTSYPAGHDRIYRLSH